MQRDEIDCNKICLSLPFTLKRRTLRRWVAALLKKIQYSSGKYIPKADLSNEAC